MRANIEIIDLIKPLSKDKSYSLSELSRLTNIPKSSLSRYFSKSREFPINKINLFSKISGVSDEYILGVDVINTF